MVAGLGVINELRTAGVKLLFSGSFAALARFEARHYVTGTVERCRAAMEWTERSERGGGKEKRRETPRALKLSRLTVRCGILPDAEIRECRVKCFITEFAQRTPYVRRGLNVRDVGTTYGCGFQARRACWRPCLLNKRESLV